MSADPSILARRIERLIAASGPISLTEYMHACLADPDHGYYSRREAIGPHGDFVTAPEISQMFGELLGLWCVETWRRLGAPSPFMLIEPGPGRGTLMRDALRAARLDPAFLRAARVNMVETSARMRALQREALGEAGAQGVEITWTRDLANLPAMTAIVIANEFLDALPFRQYVKRGTLWHEAGVGIGEDGKLTRQLLAATASPAILPAEADEAEDGAVFEHAPAREAVCADIATHLHDHGGAALFIDYGHARSGLGDTFQAVAGHAHADPFENPGLHDLTSHVDFERLAAAARGAGAHAAPVITQGEFLLSLGLLERAGRLGTAMDEAGREAIRADVERLAGPDAMGTLFKVFAFSGTLIDLPGFGDAATGA